MFIYRRFAVLLFGIICVSLTLLAYRSRDDIKSRSSHLWRQVPQKVGLGEYFYNEDDEDMYGIERAALQDSTLNITNSAEADYTDINGRPLANRPSRFKPGTVKPAGSTYTKALVMARVRKDNITWLDEAKLSPEVEMFIYEMDNRTAALRPPKNKGHEGMAYLTYIIDHYDTLRDVTIFMHPHRTAWHNNELLNRDATEMITRLSAERVTREGYMSMRCHWHPGCPDWIRPGHVNSDGDRPEENQMASAWSVLFPTDPIPAAIGTACCAQFAVSRERIRSTSIARYRQFRDWLLHTPIRDSISGRVFEYLWAKIFTDQAVFCPDQRVCYCDGFGVCFDDANEFDRVFELKYERDQREWRLDTWNKKVDLLDKARGKKDKPKDKNQNQNQKQHEQEDETEKEKEKVRVNANMYENKKYAKLETQDLEIPSVDEDVDLQAEIDVFEKDINEMIDRAKERGKDPEVRARIAGRAWKPGDGY